MSENKRLDWVDKARGFAMLSVVICHIANGFIRASMFDRYSAILYSIQNFCNSYQMPLFCLVSGFLFAKAYVTPGDGTVKKEKIKKQIYNFALLYIIWSIPFGIIKIFMGGSVNDVVKPIDLLLLPINPIGVYWWLYVLIFIYIIVSFVVEKKLNQKVVLITSCVLFVIASCLINKDWTQWLEIRRIFYYLFLFLIGMKYESTKNRQKYWYLACGCMAVAIITMVIFWKQDIEIYHIPVVNAFVALSMGIALLWFFEFINLRILKPLNSIMILCGKHSLEIFLMHVFITAGSRFVVNRLPEKGAIIWLCMVFLITIAFPILLGNLSKKIGLYNILFSPYRIIEDNKNSGRER